MIPNALLLSLLVVSGPAQKPPPEKTDFPALRRDLEVLKRILEREGLGRTGDHDGLTAILERDKWGGWGRGGEALYVPGDGALFLFRVGEPLAPDEEKPSTDGRGDAEPTLWERVRAEVDGKPLPEKGAKKPFDAERVEALKTKVLEALAKYGANVGQLRDDENLTVVLRGPSVREGGGLFGAVRSSSGDPVQDARVAYAGALGAGQETTNVSPDGSFRVWTVGGGPSTVLVLRISRGDASAFAAGSIDMGALRKRAKIAQY
ncbi:MAG TPA: hypothetical protein VFI25_06275 [Planctomycetota bacterium]|jgi:hypothetical protein|nr:hypothetical protein [Planctomycetota bacterium]